MVNRKMFKKGFTLLELLVVVAIIGLLTAVVLAALNGARNKGGDAGVKSNLHTAANQAEIFFNNGGNSYLPAGGSTLGISTCPVYSVSGTDMVSSDKTIAGAIAQATTNGSNSNACYNSSSAWTVAVSLKSNANTSWCVDSTGTAKQENFVPIFAISSSTFACK